MAGPVERASLATPFAGPGGRLIASPFQFVTDDDTNLRVISVNSQTGITLSIQGRRIDENGALQALNETHTPNSDRTTKTQDYKLGKGALLNLTIAATGGAPLIGQTYVIVQLIRGFSGAKLVLGTLLAGYITATQALGFPGSAIQTSTEGEPFVRAIAGTTPAAGADVTETCPTGARWELVTIFGNLATDPTVVNRQAGLEIRYGGARAVLTVAFVLQPASTGYGYTWAQNLSQSASGALGIVQQAMPQRQFLRAGDTFNTRTVGLQPADQWSTIVYQVREWLEVG